MHAVADAYKRILGKRGDRCVGNGAATLTTTPIVRVAHMEVSRPSIFDGLRSVLLSAAREGEGDGGGCRKLCACPSSLDRGGTCP
jgi:hypothetical protein